MQFLIDVNGQKLKNNIAIWSHCLRKNGDLVFVWTRLKYMGMYCNSQFMAINWSWLLKLT